ncbi:unnamed protein product [Cercopithifilaria johnstoni]|uniref:Uncharacterized protein n=1 Tax=Cercopithifilaria johnstoni TaxID=2874296 RepID=A0A8J2MLA9_9BILA|nr:unnamed protein product [Cercopithifilaria johnstoni]
MKQNSGIVGSQFFICCIDCELFGLTSELDKKLVWLALKILFMTNGICIRTNNDYGFCEEYPNFLPQIWFSCPGLNSNQIFGTDNMICNPYPYDSESYQIFSKDKFISDGQCIIRYKDRDYEVHCCCYHFRQNCTIRLDNKMHICADRTEMAENGIKQTVITTTLQSLPLGSSCFTSFQLNITDEETVHLISTSYGVPTMTRNDIHRCYQYISEDQSIQCSATESCQKMCPLVAPIPANLSHTLTVLSSVFSSDKTIKQGMISEPCKHSISFRIAILSS